MTTTADTTRYAVAKELRALAEMASCDDSARVCDQLLFYAADWLADDDSAINVDANIRMAGHLINRLVLSCRELESFRGAEPYRDLAFEVFTKAYGQLPFMIES